MPFLSIMAVSLIVDLWQYFGEREEWSQHLALLILPKLPARIQLILLVPILVPILLSLLILSVPILPILLLLPAPILPLFVQSSITDSVCWMRMASCTTGEEECGIYPSSITHPGYITLMAHLICSLVLRPASG